MPLQQSPNPDFNKFKLKIHVKFGYFNAGCMLNVGSTFSNSGFEVHNKALTCNFLQGLFLFGNAVKAGQ